MPNTEEYMKNGVVSSGVQLVMLHVYFLLGEELTTDKVELIESNPRIVSAAATILRLYDDLGSAKVYTELMILTTRQNLKLAWYQILVNSFVCVITG